MQNNNKINYNDYVKDDEMRLDMLPPDAIRNLLLALATNRVPIYNGRKYTASEIADLSARQTAGERVRKISPFVCDFLAEQGARVEYIGEYCEKPAKAEQVYANPPVLHISPIDTTVSCKDQDLPLNNGIVDAIGVRSDDKKYPYGVKLREDIAVFCTFLKVDVKNENFVWATTVRSVGPYSQFKLTGDIPFKLLDTKIPKKKLKGAQLYEYLIQNKEYHKFVRTVVATMLKNDVVPVIENGVPLIVDGQFCDQYANALIMHSNWTELVREYRPAPLTFKVKPDYQGAQYIESMFTQINKKNFVRVNSGYYDGLDASVERDAIRSKIEIIMEYAYKFPDTVYIVTGVQEEGISLQKSLQAVNITSHIVSERSAHNYSGFHIWMKERNIEENMPIADKLTVKPIVAKDGAILRAVYSNSYAYGFGFMTNLLVHHYAKDNIPTSTAVGTNPTEYCKVVVGTKEKVTRYFKQLPSKKPLHFYPYIYTEDGDTYGGSNATRLYRTWFHMWTLISWVRSKQSVITRLKYPAHSIHWRKGKDILDFNVEDQDFQELAQVVKSRDNEVAVPSRRLLSRQRVEGVRADRPDNVVRIPQKSVDPVKSGRVTLTAPPRVAEKPPVSSLPEKNNVQELFDDGDSDGEDSQLQAEDDD